MKILISQWYYGKKMCFYLFEYRYTESWDFDKSIRIDEKSFYNKIWVQSKCNMHWARFAICTLGVLKCSLLNNGYSIAWIQQYD